MAQDLEDSRLTSARAAVFDGDYWQARQLCKQILRADPEPQLRRATEELQECLCPDRTSRNLVILAAVIGLLISIYMVLVH